MLQEALGDLNRGGVEMFVAFSTGTRQYFISTIGFTGIEAGKGFKRPSLPKARDHIKTGFGQQHFAIACPNPRNRCEQSNEFDASEAPSVRIGQRQGPE